jgi:hypothetical protein
MRQFARSAAVGPSRRMTSPASSTIMGLTRPRCEISAPIRRVLARSAFRRCSPTSSWRFCSRCLGRKGLRINRSERMLQLLRSAWRDVGSAIIPAPAVLYRHTPVSCCQSRGPGGRPDRDLCLHSRGNGCFCPGRPPLRPQAMGSAPTSTSGLPPSPPQARREPPAPPGRDRRLRAKTWRSPLAHSRWRARSF